METNSKPASNTPGNPASEMSFRRRAWEFWRRNQLLFVQLPITLAILYYSYVFLRTLDSRIGVEGFGDLFGYMLNVVRAIIIVFNAWWMKKWLFFDLHDQTELDLFKRMRDDKDMVAYWIVVRDRVEWIALLLLNTWWYTR